MIHNTEFSVLYISSIIKDQNNNHVNNNVAGTRKNRKSHIYRQRWLLCGLANTFYIVS